MANNRGFLGYCILGTEKGERAPVVKGVKTCVVQIGSHTKWG